MDALKDSEDADPPKNMKRALIFQAVLAVLAAPAPLCLGLFGRKAFVRRKREEADRSARNGEVIEGYSDGRDEDEQVLNARTDRIA